MDVVLLSETRLTAVAQQVMRAGLGPQGGRHSAGLRWNPGGAGGAHLGCAGQGDGDRGAPGQSRETSPPP